MTSNVKDAVEDTVDCNVPNTAPNPFFIGTVFEGRSADEFMKGAVRKAEMMILEKQHLLELENAKTSPNAETVSGFEEFISRQQGFVDRTKAWPGYDWSTYVSPTLSQALASEMKNMRINRSHSKKLKGDKGNVEANTAAQASQKDNDDNETMAS